MKEVNLALFQHIDTEALKALADIGDAEDQAFLQKLFMLFQQDTDKSLLLLQQHIDNDDFPAIASFAHRLKSSAENLAAYKLSMYFKALEESANQQEKQGISTSWSKIQENYKRVILDLERYIA